MITTNLKEIGSTNLANYDSEADDITHGKEFL